jgi:hypothetical protein
MLVLIVLLFLRGAPSFSFAHWRRDCSSIVTMSSRKIFGTSSESVCWTFFNHSGYSRGELFAGKWDVFDFDLCRL